MLFNRYWKNADGALLNSSVRENSGEWEFQLFRVESSNHVLLEDGLTKGFHKTPHAALAALESLARESKLVPVTREGNGWRELT